MGIITVAISVKPSGTDSWSTLLCTAPSILQLNILSPSKPEEGSEIAAIMPALRRSPAAVVATAVAAAAAPVAAVKLR